MFVYIFVKYLNQCLLIFSTFDFYYIFHSWLFIFLFLAFYFCINRKIVRAVQSQRVTFTGSSLNPGYIAPSSAARACLGSDKDSQELGLEKNLVLRRLRQEDHFELLPVPGLQSETLKGTERPPETQANKPGRFFLSYLRIRYLTASSLVVEPAASRRDSSVHAPL